MDQPARPTGLDPAQAADLFRREPDRFLDVGAGEVAYRVVGSGPDVLFVHGWPVSAATFRTLLPHLADHVTCHLIDLPGAGSSRYTPDIALSIRTHIQAVRRTLDLLELDDVAVVGHDSGGLIARHALAGDGRMRALGLIDTEMSTGTSWKFRAFLAGRKLPGFGAALGWLAGKPRLRRHPLILGDAFADSSLLEGEFDEFFLQPLHRSARHRGAAVRILRTFDYGLVRDLAALHRRIDVPVVLVWGEEDKFFPLAMAREMVAEFADARIEPIPGAGLFAHEERPADVARALLPTLTGA
ncbi:MAG: alpha/beta fold hydrolase [Ilumatobacteraceae bacterium]